MRAIGLCILFVLTSTQAIAFVTDPAPPDINQLLEVYRRFGLPLPPAEAPLVRVQVAGGGLVNGKAQPPEHALAFLVKSESDGTPVTVLLGTREQSPSYSTAATVMNPEKAALDSDDHWGTDLFLALQCKARGWDELAKRLLKRCLEGVDTAPDSTLAKEAWHYWLAELGKSGTDRARIAKFMKVVLAARPMDFEEYHKKQVERLELALVPSKAPQGSIESLIDGLVEVTRTDLGHPPERPNPHYLNLLHRGFEAVPQLIEHLNDERLTRARKEGFNNFHGYQYQVKDVISDLLQGLAGKELNKSWLHRQQGYSLENADVEAWWREAQKVGEEAYVVGQVLVGERRSPGFPNGVLLELIVHKYPERLPEIYQRLLRDHPKMIAWPVTDAITRSRLPREKKRELFLEGAKSPDLGQRPQALRLLRDVDPVEADRLLTETLEALPATPTVEYWLCPEASIASLVAGISNDELWAALGKYAKRCDVGIRLEIMGRMTYTHLGDRAREQRIRFVSRFLDDDTLRDASTNRKMFTGPYAGFAGFEKIEVRDFAAMQLAHLLKLKVKPEPNWGPAEWEKLRKQVKEALVRSAGAAASITPDTLLLNAKLWTVNPKQPETTALAVWQDRILAVGSDADLRQLAGPQTKVIDLKGRRVVPGFYDSHVHLLGSGLRLAQVQLKDAKDEAEFGRRLQEFDRKLPKDRWLLGGEWDHDRTFGGQLPTATLVDKYVPDRPVFLRRYDGHMALVNTKVLKMAGINAKTPDKSGGVIFKLPNGEPSGILRDNAMDLVSDTGLIPPTSDLEMAEAIRAVLKEAREVGVTSVQDMDGSDASTRRKLFRLYQQLQRAGQLTLRIDLRWPLGEWKALADLGVQEGFGNDWVRIGGLKGFADGSLGSSTAKMFEPFVNEPNSTGVFITQPNQMREWVREADKAGLSVCVHAIGDQANATMLEIYGEAAKTNGPRDRRFRIEHAQHVRPEDYARFAQLGVIASVQPYHIIDDGRWAEGRIGTKRCASSYGNRSFLDAKARVAFGSDWSVAPLNPLLGIDAAVNRRTLDGKHPDGWFPEQKITVAEAIEAFTLGSAFAGFQERDRGSLEVGKLADLVVLSRDILDPKERDHIAETKVLLTMVGGRIVMTND